MRSSGWDEGQESWCVHDNSENLLSSSRGRQEKERKATNIARNAALVPELILGIQMSDVQDGWGMKITGWRGPCRNSALYGVLYLYLLARALNLGGSPLPTDIRPPRNARQAHLGSPHVHFRADRGSVLGKRPWERHLEVASEHYPGI